MNGDTKLVDKALGMMQERRKDIYERYHGHYVMEDFFWILWSIV